MINDSWKPRSRTWRIPGTRNTYPIVIEFSWAHWACGTFHREVQGPSLIKVGHHRLDREGDNFEYHRWWLYLRNQCRSCHLDLTIDRRELSSVAA